MAVNSSSGMKVFGFTFKNPLNAISSKLYKNKSKIKNKNTDTARNFNKYLNMFFIKNTFLTLMLEAKYHNNPLTRLKARKI